MNIKKTIEIATVIPVSEVNGPGCRSVVWVQGCAKRCQGCWNPDFLNFKKGRWSLTAEELVETLRRITNNFSLIEGITFSGGEPFDQSNALAKAAYLFKKLDLSIVSYSGYILEEIKSKGSPQTDLLANLDILIDGEYIHELHCDRLWRSSLNQKVHFLSDRYLKFSEKIDQRVREFEVSIRPEELQITGFPKSRMI
jgi:anaerobic ribonucleoside-triphosphate reductase activating protein